MSRNVILNSVYVFPRDFIFNEEAEISNFDIESNIPMLKISQIALPETLVAAESNKANKQIEIAQPSIDLEKAVSTATAATEVIELKIVDSDEEVFESIMVEDCEKISGLQGYELYVCYQCQLHFPSAADFKNHCGDCIKNYPQKSKPKPFKCYHCEKTFKFDTNLVSHIKGHGEPRFGCSLCSFKHPRQMNLK